MCNDEDEVICCMRVDEATQIHKDSVRAKCSDCFDDIYCMPHNIDKKKVCMKCVAENYLTDNDTVLKVKEIDLKKAFEHIKENQKNGGVS